MYSTKELFFNETEFTDNSSDYRKFAPEVMSDYSVGEFVGYYEKTKLKKHYNRTSLIMILYTFGSTALSYLFVMGISLGLGIWSILTDENYTENFLEIPVIIIALNTVIFLIVNLLTYHFGCKVNKIDKSKFFETRNFNIGLCIIYVFTSLGIQFITGSIAEFINDFMNAFGINNYSPNFETTTAPALILSFLYGCIIAPITEELLYRGFVLKSFSVVSQKTGIFVSALFFALCHQNIAQGLLAFPVGLLMGYIAVKHNSLFPGIIVHFCVNLFATVCNDILPFFNISDEVYGIINYTLIMGALISAIFFLVKERMPKKNGLQAPRTTLMYAAPLFWVYIGYNIIETIGAIVMNNLGV